MNTKSAMEYLSAFLLFVILLITLYIHHQEKSQWATERKDLYDRLMARDLSDYKLETAETEKEEEETESTVVDLYSPEAINDLQSEEDAR